MKRAWLGVGGNIGDVRASMIAALVRLDANSAIAVERVSGLYRTPPWGMSEQPAFMNACAELTTGLSPPHLLEACLDAEKLLRRVRRQRWGPRTIDIDILAMDEVGYASPGLTIPHPQLTERAFVLVPLADLAPDLVVGERTIRQWLSRADTKGIARLAGPAPWSAEGNIWKI